MKRYRVYMVVDSELGETELLDALGASTDGALMKAGVCAQFVAVRDGYAGEFRALGADPTGWTNATLHSFRIHYRNCEGSSCQNDVLATDPDHARRTLESLVDETIVIEGVELLDPIVEVPVHPPWLADTMPAPPESGAPHDISTCASCLKSREANCSTGCAGWYLDANGVVQTCAACHIFEDPDEVAHVIQEYLHQHGVNAEQPGWCLILANGERWEIEADDELALLTDEMAVRAAVVVLKRIFGANVGPR